MREPEPFAGWRVVAAPPALDALEARTGAGVALRIAADDLLVLSGEEKPVLDDPDAIVEPETGFVGWELDPPAVRALLVRHVEWQPPAPRPTLAQGLVAAVPAKLWLREDGSALLLCLAAYAAELEARLA